MKLTEFAKQLGTIGYPVAYNHFKNTPNNPAPEPPFIIYLEEDSNNFGADNKVLKQVVNYRIEVYSDEKDFDLEEQIEQLLDENNIFYDTDELFIKQENLYQRMYFITLIK